MPAVLEHHEARIGKRGRKRLGSLERNGVVPAMQNQHGNFYLFDALQEVEVTKTFPHLLLDATDDSERGQVVGAGRVREVAGDGELERALAIGVWITFTQPRARQLLPELEQRRARLPLAEVGLELRPISAGHRCRIDEGEAQWGRRGLASALERFHGIEQGEQTAPRIANDREWLADGISRDQAEVGDVSLPGDWGAILGLRLPTSPLVVEDHVVLLGQREHLREEIIVMRARSSMENEQPRRAFTPVRRPIERDGRGRREA